jgi:hypothetical protein
LTVARHPLVLPQLGSILLLALGCSSSDSSSGSSANEAGASAGGGDASHGAHAAGAGNASAGAVSVGPGTGGAGTGAAASGGSSTGGDSAGGSAGGGSSGETTGGTTSGGSGGDSAGGAAAGGTGGDGTGGDDAGGTGGDGTGGDGTGGADAGGTGGDGTGGADAGGTGGDGTGGLPWLHVQGNEIQDPGGNRVILRGISLIDLGAQDAWYGGVTEVIDRITDASDTQGDSPGWYPKVLRLPVSPPDYDPPLTFEPGNDDYYNDLLRPTVEYCREKSLYAIIDLHYVDDTSVNPDYVSQFWTYMAPRFANDSHVMFELYNEPIDRFGTDEENWESVRSRMQGWVDIVRAAAPDNLILAGTPSWCQTLVPTIDSPLSGGNIVYVVHTYPSHWLNRSYRNQISTTATVHPLIMTEWGFSQSDYPEPGASITEYGRPIMEFVEQHGVSNTAWVASTDWGPPMFWSDWTLRVGEGEMGGWVKDRLYEMRDSDLPSN